MHTLIKYCILAIMTTACTAPSSHQQKKQNTDQTANKHQKPPFTLEYKNGSQLHLGDSLSFAVTWADSINFDSASLLIDNKPTQQFVQMPQRVQVRPITGKVGNRNIGLKVFAQGKSYIQAFSVRLFSDIAPPTHGYKVVNSYAHDINAYTQGLFYRKGKLYEATGLKGESSIRLVQLETGKIEQSYTIDGRIFGEGITPYHDRIVQLSWQARKGFVYDINTFEQLLIFDYPTEGWGITTIGDSLYMSDGSHSLYILDPNNYAEIGRLEVFDNRVAVSQLNELEYINGEIWANIYQTDKVVRIDPHTGKVLSYIDFTDLLPQKYHHQRLDVLNGIAFDQETERIFVTGKRWPLLFDVKITD